MHLSIERGRAPGPGSFGAVRLLEGTQTTFLMTAYVSPVRRRGAFKAGGRGFDLQFTMDYSQYPTTHQVLVQGASHDTVFSGTFDPRTSHFQIGDGPLPCAGSITTEFNAFAPQFAEISAYASELRKPFEAIIHHTIHNSDWGNIGQAACWGFATMGAAASTFFIGGATELNKVNVSVVNGLWAAAAQFCSLTWDSLHENPGGTWTPDTKPDASAPTGDTPDMGVSDGDPWGSPPGGSAENPTLDGGDGGDSRASHGSNWIAPKL